MVVSSEVPNRGGLHCQSEQLISEAILAANVLGTHPPRLPFPDHVQRFVPLDRPLRRLKFPKTLLRFHPSFDGSMILFQYII